VAVIEPIASIGFRVTVVDAAGEVDPSKFASPPYRAVMLWVPRAAYVTVHVAPPATNDRLTHEGMGSAPSKNSTDPDGSIGPGRAAGGETVAV
jgi:hypothetical protein